MIHISGEKKKDIDENLNERDRILHPIQVRVESSQNHGPDASG